MKKDYPPKGWRIAVEILFAAFEQKDCNGEPQQMLIKVPLVTAPSFFEHHNLEILQLT